MRGSDLIVRLLSFAGAAAASGGRVCTNKGGGFTSSAQLNGNRLNLIGERTQSEN